MVANNAKLISALFGAPLALIAQLQLGQMQAHKSTWSCGSNPYLLKNGIGEGGQKPFHQPFYQWINGFSLCHELIRWYEQIPESNCRTNVCAGFGCARQFTKAHCSSIVPDDVGKASTHETKTATTCAMNLLLWMVNGTGKPKWLFLYQIFSMSYAQMAFECKMGGAVPSIPLIHIIYLPPDHSFAASRMHLYNSWMAHSANRIAHDHISRWRPLADGTNAQCTWIGPPDTGSCSCGSEGDKLMRMLCKMRKW